MVSSRHDRDQSGKIAGSQHPRNVKKQKNAVPSTSLNMMVDSSNEDRPRVPANNIKSDLIGIHMARLLNEGAFNKAMHASTQAQSHPPELFPLVSATNFNRTKKVLKSILQIFLGSKTQNKEAWLTYCRNFFKSLLICAVIVSVGAGAILSFLIRIYLFVAISFFTLMFDVRYVYNNICPTIIQRFVRGVEKIIKLIDRRCLLAHSIHGRNHFGEELIEKTLRERNAPEVLLRARKRGTNEIQIKSFRNVDWLMLERLLKSENDIEYALHSKTIDHLVAVNFAYVMMKEYGDQKDFHKKRNKRQVARGAKDTRDMQRNNDFVLLDRDDVDVVELSREVGVMDTRDLTIIDPIQIQGGIELVDSNPMSISLRPPMKRQKSSQRRANLRSFDETDDINNQIHVSDQNDEFGSPSRARVCSETDIYFYDSDEHPNQGEDHHKNMKWLDVGAKIGMRILKSDQVKDFISQTKTISGDIGEVLDDDLSFSNSHELGRESEIPSPQIPKPFHAMWQTECNELFDNDSYLSMDSDDASHMHKKRSLPISPLVSPLKPRQTISLSPRRMRSSISHQTFSVPSSPRASKQLRINTYQESEGNGSMTSSEAIQWVPREFDANRYIPACLAINHGVLTNKQSTLPVQICTPNEIRMRQTIITRPRSHRQRAPLSPGVKIVVPLFPLCSSSKSMRNSLEGRVHQLATVLSSKRIVLKKSVDDLDSTDALSITVLLDKSFLRNGKFARMTLRYPDSQRQFPR